MCGLLFSLRIISKGQDDDDLIFDALAQTVKPRGPDSFNLYVSHLALDSDHLLEIKLAASVLGLRGEGIVSQPVEDGHGVLGWNGQVFRGVQVGLEENDTVKLFERLKNGENPRKVLAGVEGPYACIYLDKSNNELYFQVDPLSRRSLLVHPPDLNTVSDRIIICSARSGDAIIGDLPMRALDGGEGGCVLLEKIIPRDGKISLEGALTSYTSEEDLSSIWTHVAPINASLPVDADLPSPTTEVDAFLANLTASIRLRVENIPSAREGQSRLAILFSGGVDCTLLAAIAHQYAIITSLPDYPTLNARCLPIDEPIDLVNVGFQRSPEAPNTEAEYRVPDRISGLEAADELRSCCPGRTWRFVEVNVPYEESMQHRQKILDLMYPSATEMDLSLAWPLYFASRGVGTSQTETDGPKRPYTVLPRVYLSGLGADEQLAGYKRHQTAFNRGQWPELISELQMDISRLPTRNLSRDDRLISSHARDARFPYLDLTFINYLSSLPVWLKCDPTVPGGDKLLLRLAARKLGLHNTSERVKRAMQFGTRSAKVGGRGKGAKKGDLPVHQFE